MFGWLASSPFSANTPWIPAGVVVGWAPPNTSGCFPGICSRGTRHLGGSGFIWVREEDTAALLRNSFEGCLICSGKVLPSKRGYMRSYSDASHSSSTLPWHNSQAETSPYTRGIKSNRTTAMKCWVFPRVKHAQHQKYGKQNHILTFLNSFKQE